MWEKIALFGGTFNPVHVGHLIAAERVKEIFSLSRVIFVPAASPPHKPISDVIEAHHRYAMLCLATLDNSVFDVSDIEILRGGSSYTIDTIKYFRQLYNSSNALLYFILGVDAFMEIHTWKESSSLLHMSNFIVITRPCVDFGMADKYIAECFSGFEKGDKKNEPPEVHGVYRSLVSPNTSVYFVNTPAIDISSNYIRMALRSGKSIRYMVHDSVFRYIVKENLYRM